MARIDGAAGPDRRETFGVACSPSDTTRLSVTNISWQEGANARADRGIHQGEGAGMRKSGRKGRGHGVYGHREEKIEGVVYRYVRVRTVPVYVYSCAADRIGIRIGSTNGRKLVTAGLSDLCAERPPPPPSFSFLTPLGRSIALSTPLSPSPCILPSCFMSISPTS